MKKLLCALMAALLLFTMAFPAAALPRSLGVSILRLQFSHGEGPLDETEGINADYSWFSPVKGEDDETLYPLVVITPGALEGQKEGEELVENNFAMWACDEFQKEFYRAGGAFIMIARAQEDVSLLLNWSSDRMVEPLYAAITDFCENNPNVDVSRIYGIGWCQGAKAMINMEVKHPEVFSAVVLAVQNFEIDDADAAAMADSNVWMLGSKMDTLGLYNQYVLPSWNKLKESAAEGSARMFTTYSKAKDTGLALQHNVWDDMSYNWDYSPKNNYAKSTVDGEGNKLSISSFIATLSRMGMGDIEDEEKPLVAPLKLICDCGCREYNAVELIVIRLYNRIVTTLAKLLRTTTYVDCDCESCAAAS